MNDFLIDLAFVLIILGILIIHIIGWKRFWDHEKKAWRDMWDNL